MQSKTQVSEADHYKSSVHQKRNPRSTPMLTNWRKKKQFFKHHQNKLTWKTAMGLSENIFS